MKKTSERVASSTENVTPIHVRIELCLVMASHAGMTTDEFAAILKKWLTTARHPRFGRPYNELVFQPMLELLEYLRANGFKTYIVSGGGIELLRVFAKEVYGIPPEQVVGSSIKTKFELRDEKPAIVRLPEIDFIDDEEGKPVAINKFIGRRPIAAFGKSDGDIQMLQCTAAGDAPRFCLLVHHTDAEREWAYRSQIPYRATGQGPGRGTEAWLDDRRHEAGLEGHLHVPKIVAQR